MALQEAISTYMDIRGLIPQLYDEESKKWIAPQLRIRGFILRNDAQLRGQLELYYGQNLFSTPRLQQPYPEEGNQGAGVLLAQDTTGANVVSVDVNSETLFSQVYRIEFTGETAFDVTSELSGTQGSGTTGVSFTTTDTYLTIPKECWNGTFAKEDVHYVQVYNYDGLLVHLSSLLTASNLLDTIFTEEVPDASVASTRYTRLYNRLIGQLQDGVITLPGKQMLDRNLDPIQVDYVVDEYGRDITNYEEYEWSPTRPFDDTGGRFY